MSVIKRVIYFFSLSFLWTYCVRVFVRTFKFDTQSLFGSTKAFGRISSSFARILCKPCEGNQVVLIISWVLYIFEPIVGLGILGIFGSFTQAVVLTLMSRMQLTKAPRLMRRLRQRRPLLLWVVLFFPSLLPRAALLAIIAIGNSGADTIISVALLQFQAVPVLLQIGAMVLLSYSPQTITDLTSGPWGRRILYVFKGISILSLIFGLAVLEDTIQIIRQPVIAVTTVVLLFGSLQDPVAANSQFGRWIDMILHLCILLPSAVRPINPLRYIVLLSVLLIGNMQIPVAVAQVVLSSWRLHNSHVYNDQNMVASTTVFYGLAACQGSLYIMACILARFSFFPRRSLVHTTGFQGKWAIKAVDLYYERAYTTRMETGVFAKDKISLSSFVIDSLNSAYRSSESEAQLAGVCVLHSFLQRRASYEEQLSEITRSEKTVPTLISMLGWTLEQDRDIRLFAARVIAQLSYDIRIAGIPGAVKKVSLLLDAKNNAGNNEVRGGARNEPRQDMLPEATNVNGNNVAINQSSDQEPPHNGGNSSNRSVDQELRHRAGNNRGWCSWLCGCCQWMKRKWSILEEQPLTYHDHGSLPILGMVILERLACDPDNCEEILKIRNLIPKIVGLISYSSNNESNNALICSSLNLVTRLATTSGIGVNLRLELWECPFLHSNPARVMEDSRSNPDIWKAAVDIIATLALDEGARHELGSVQMSIHRLVHLFVIGRDGATDYDQALPVAAGGALANLAMESPANCISILEERQDLVNDLKDFLGNDEYRCVAANLLQNLCACSRISKLHHNAGVQTLPACSRLRDRLRGRVSDHLSSALPVVLKNIMAAEGKQLEALIGLASQILYVLPSGGFVQGLESRTNPAGLVTKLVNTLNSNRKPSAEFPRMRRVIVETVISVVESHPRYANIFSEQSMKEALSEVEETPSKVERYRVFLGNEGLVVETGEPLSDLARRAKGLVSATLTPGAQQG